MIDLLYLAYNRLEFTKLSLSYLLANTDQALVSRLVIYDDGSTDGTRDFLEAAVAAVSSSMLGIPVELRLTRLGGPVAVMNHFLGTPGTEIFAKIDNDTIVPRGWLNDCAWVMHQSPELDLLGIEPPLSRKRPAGNNGRPLVNPQELAPGPLRYIRASSIGGVGLMCRRAFDTRRKLQPHHIYGGFTDWQLAHKDLVAGWIAPPIKLFLLDRMPQPHFRRLSDDYIAKGWQRPWGNYTDDDRELWSWCPAANIEEIAYLENCRVYNNDDSSGFVVKSNDEGQFIVDCRAYPSMEEMEEIEKVRSGRKDVTGPTR